MFSHVMVGAKDLEASRKFYDAALGTLGISPGMLNRDIRYFYRSPTGVFAFTLPLDNQSATPANGGTIGFAAKSPEEVDAFHAAGVANGGITCEDPPGWRDGPAGRLYLAYLRDPAGNKICSMFREPKK
jgi:catechol 2,3-dioxygenase-like lactoylglutathione lyase family enzyme